MISRAWKVAPALAVGCTIVMKPSELTPLTALVSPHFIVTMRPPLLTDSVAQKLSELVKEAGCVLNTLPTVYVKLLIDFLLVS